MSSASFSILVCLFFCVQFHKKVLGVAFICFLEVHFHLIYWKLLLSLVGNEFVLFVNYRGCSYSREHHLGRFQLYHLLCYCGEVCTWWLVISQGAVTGL